MLKELEDYGWKEAFGYTGGEDACNHGMPMQAEYTTGKISEEAFTREDVDEIRHIQVGDNDGPEWIVVGHLKDGRWFYLTAGCDYTGWDCQSSGSSFVAGSYEEIIRWGLGDQERHVFGIVIPNVDDRLRYRP